MLKEGFENTFDSSLLDYRGDFEKGDNYELRDWLSNFVEDFNDDCYTIEYINDESCIDISCKNINIILKPNETMIPYKFHKVTGNFNCSWNGLTTLKNCPDIVSGTFNCSYNNLKTLDFMPIARYYNLSYNNLSLGSLNALIDKVAKKEKHPIHNLDRNRFENGIDLDPKTTRFVIKGNKRLIKYISHPMYTNWITSSISWDDD